jgi:glycosyltransferase involved in cell wall biosynthesis
MATGLFPIVSDIKANSAWITHGVDGLLHKVGDPEHLADCIEQLVARPEIAREAVLCNREKVVRDGDRATNMAKLESIYERLASTGPAIRQS